MAALDAATKKLCRRDFADSVMSRREVCNVLKADLDAAVTAIDQWVEDNAIPFNLAIPLPARTILTAKQKAELLLAVVRKRFEVA